MRALSMLGCVLVAACAAGPDPAFVLAARDMVDVVSPEYRHYVDADPALTAEQRARRHRTVLRFEEAVRVREQR